MSAPLFARDTSSGCGIGWEVNGDKSFMGTSTRGTTHAYTAPPTFGMTSGTSGCDKHSIVKNEVKSLHYAEGNFNSLMVEMSQGRGEFLTGFAVVLGCGSAEVEFGSIMQAHYRQIFAQQDTTPAQMLQQVALVIQANPLLTAHCHVG